MARFNIGIDTGGTYTDAVVVDLESRRVLASAKAHTTHGDLSIGVSESLTSVLSDLGEDFPREQISLVSVSTTLATNALVEGQGAPVACLLIGFDDAMAERARIHEAVPGTHILRINGGHSHSGEELHALDEDAIRKAYRDLGSSVQGFAIGSLYSVRNASHELRAAAIIREQCELPVTLSCDLSAELDGPRRALTATLNARIVSRIIALVTAVRQSLQKEEIDARLMIVRGDGSLANADLVVEKPIETILSGPAASVIGARYLSRLENFIISDIGGTTTDIATAHNGWPDVNRKGSMVGEYRTLVHAIDMRTYGLGGDSEVLTDYSGSVSLSTRRVIPVAMLGKRWPMVAAYLRAVLKAGSGFRTACRFIVQPEGLDIVATPRDLHDDERELMLRVGDEPQPWSSLISRKSDEERLAGLVSQGLLQVAGFTPSDAAHALDRQDNWDLETARLACQVQGQYCGRISANQEHRDAEVAAFAEHVVDAVVRKSSRLLIEKLARREISDDDPLVESVSSGRAVVSDLQVMLKPSIPLIAVGGPAHIYYPEVGRRLNADTHIPEHCEVANAIGAAVGMIRSHSIIEITARDEGGYFIHGPEAPELAASAAEALLRAEAIARELSEAQAKAMGAARIDTSIDVQRVLLPDTDEELGLVSATVSAESTGAL